MSLALFSISINNVFSKRGIWFTAHDCKCRSCRVQYICKLLKHYILMPFRNFAVSCFRTSPVNTVYVIETCAHTAIKVVAFLWCWQSYYSAVILHGCWNQELWNKLFLSEISQEHEQCKLQILTNDWKFKIIIVSAIHF